MKNLLVFGLVAAVTVLMSGESASASNKHKSYCKSYLILKNCCCNKHQHDNELEGDAVKRPPQRKCHTMCCFIFKQGDREPRYYRDVKYKMVTINPCSTHRVSLKEGKYLVFCIPARLCEKLGNKSKFSEMKWIGAPTKIYVKCNKDQCFHVNEKGMRPTKKSSASGSSGSGYGGHGNHDKCRCDQCGRGHGGGSGKPPA